MKQFNEYIILIADDDEDDIQFFEEALEELQVKVKLIAVKNGIQLINYLQDDCDVPHILFLDLNMPLKNGTESLKEIQLLDNCKDLFIVIYSTAISQSELSNLQAHGSRHYIRKPNEFTKIKTAISTVLSILTGTLVYDEFIIDLDRLKHD